MILESIVTCPRCPTAKSETMPTDACRYFYECTGCGARLRPKEGDCCVFCSCGSVPCPPVQAERSGEMDATSCCGGQAIMAESAIQTSRGWSAARSLICQRGRYLTSRFLPGCPLVLPSGIALI